ncbi:MAG: 4Fe-4S binding protein, partial [Desulfamplus sp.]|nr:4Fe-4S binding protein [Desulfamplus sp.]
MQLTAINNNCSGCGTCKLACSIENYRETCPSKAVLKIVGLFPSPGKYEIYLCDQCGECAKVCPVEAIQADENGVYTVNKDECISCMACVDACPKAGLLSSNKILTKYVSFHKAIQSISEYAGYKAEKIWRLFNMNL